MKFSLKQINNMHQPDMMDFTVACVNSSIVSISGQSRAGEKPMLNLYSSKDINRKRNHPKRENENSTRSIPKIRR